MLNGGARKQSSYFRNLQELQEDDLQKSLCVASMKQSKEIEA